jgi:hypothetical protein
MVQVKTILLIGPNGMLQPSPADEPVSSWLSRFFQQVKSLYSLPLHSKSASFLNTC